MEGCQRSLGLMHVIVKGKGEEEMEGMLRHLCLHNHNMKSWINAHVRKSIHQCCTCDIILSTNVYVIDPLRYVTLASPLQSHYEVGLVVVACSLQTLHVAVMSHHIISKLSLSLSFVINRSMCDLLCAHVTILMPLPCHGVRS